MSTASRGFTLLEVLIATMLTAVLMAGLWALFDTYEKLFSRGQQKVENAQLVRALLEQISADLASAIPDSSASRPGQSPSVRRFGLFGTQHAMQVDVLSPTESQLLSATTAADAGATADESPMRPGRVPELHTVQYLFEQADELEPAETGQVTGLIRRQLGWDATSDNPQGQTSGASPRGKRPSFASAALDPMRISAVGLDPEDDSLLVVPEVVGLEFRYFDGSGWSSEWNSLTRKSLPAAVEVALTVARNPAGERPSPEVVAAAEEQEGFESATAVSKPSSSGSAATYTHRLLVYLPGTALAAVSRGAPDDGAFSSLPSRPVFQPPRPPGPPPGRGPRGRSSGSVLAEQWMRAGP